MLKITKTYIKDLLIIDGKQHDDNRGYLKETYRKNILNEKNFLFDVMSFSKKNVLRGLHIQSKKKQAKIITVTHGKILDVAVDLRKESNTFGKYIAIKISNTEFLFKQYPHRSFHTHVAVSFYSTKYLFIFQGFY